MHGLFCVTTIRGNPLSAAEKTSPAGKGLRKTTGSQTAAAGEVLEEEEAAVVAVVAAVAVGRLAES